MLSGRYQLGADDYNDLYPYNFYGDRYGVDFTLSTNFGAASASLSVGYSNEFLLNFPTRAEFDEPGEFRVSARIYLRPDSATRVATTYDSLNDTLTVSASRDAGRGIDRWAASVDVQRDGYEDYGLASTSVTYYGNRAEVQASPLGFRPFRLG
jgi:hypothetical protein